MDTVTEGESVGEPEEDTDDMVTEDTEDTVTEDTVTEDTVTENV